MEDRQLLEKVAKVEGIKIYFWSQAQGAFQTDHEDDLERLWDPLTNDHHAFRLAVKYHLWDAMRTAHRLVGSKGCPDIYAATRRSIVMAVAALADAQTP